MIYKLPLSWVMNDGQLRLVSEETGDVLAIVSSGFFVIYMSLTSDTIRATCSCESIAHGRSEVGKMLQSWGVIEL